MSSLGQWAIRSAKCAGLPAAPPGDAFFTGAVATPVTVHAEHLVAAHWRCSSADLSVLPQHPHVRNDGLARTASGARVSGHTPVGLSSVHHPHTLRCRLCCGGIKSPQILHRYRGGVNEAVLCIRRARSTALRELRGDPGCGGRGIRHRE